MVDGVKVCVRCILPCDTRWTKCKACLQHRRDADEAKLSKIPRLEGQRVCVQCAKAKQENEFLRHVDQDGEPFRNSRCRDCFHRSSKRVEEDPLYILFKQRRDAFLATRCAICNGIAHQCDHIDRATKVKNISNFAYWIGHKSLSRQDKIARFEAELAKCQPLCGSCHLTKTAAENIRPRITPAQITRRQLGDRHNARMREAKFNMCFCRICKCWVREHNLGNFQFDHVNPMDKTVEISAMRGATDERFKEELAKCQLLCVQCHVERTTDQRSRNMFKRVNRHKKSKVAEDGVAA